MYYYIIKIWNTNIKFEIYIYTTLIIFKLVLFYNISLLYFSRGRVIAWKTFQNTVKVLKITEIIFIKYEI